MRVQVPYNIPLVLFFLLLAIQTFSQTFLPNEKIQFKRLTHQEGFPARNILCMLQDRKGFLWMAAPDRLIRFDGKRQKLFRYSSNDNNSISSNTVRAMLEDKNGLLWFGTTGGGINKFDPSTEKFTRYYHNAKDPNSISLNDITAICEDSYGNFWIGTLGGGLNKFDRKFEKFIAYKNDPANINSLSNNNVSIVYEDSKGNLWIGTNGGGLNKLEITSKKFTRFIHNPSSQNSLSNNNVTGIIEDKNGALLISTLGGGLNKIYFEKGFQNPVFIHYKNNPKDPNSLISNNINFLYLDRENIIWIGTDEGINKIVQNELNNSSEHFVSYKNDKYDIFSLIDNNVNCIYEDNSGMLWVSTGGAGLHIYDKKQKQFKLFENEPNNKFSLSSTAVISVYEDREGTRWIGTRDGGLNKMEKGSNKFIHYKRNPIDPNSLSDNNIYSIYEDKQGVLWFGTANGGLNSFDKKTEKFFTYKHDPSDPSSISDNRILAITEDHSGNLWIGTSLGGLNQFNRVNKTFTHYRFNPDDSNSISSDYVSDLYCDITGKLLIATKEGLDQFDQQTKNFIHIELNEKGSDPNKHTRVTALYEQKNGILWIGTFDRGLIKYQRGQGIIRVYTAKDGFPIDYITGILDDDHGNLWVSTSIGVTKFDPYNETMRTYIYEDGIQGIGEKRPVKSKTGELIFGGVMGLNIFFPDSIRDYSHLPPVHFTDLYLFNKRVPIGYDSLTDRTILSKSLTETDEIILNYSDNVLTIDFAIIDFHSIFKWNRFAYNMEGFDKDWTNIAPFLNRSALNQRSVTYTNLNPGEYTLKIKAANSDDIWNEDYASLKLIILPPWYSTIWAYFMYIILLGSIIYFAWKFQINRIRIRNEVEMSKFEAKKFHEVDEIKTKFFTNISHEFRTPLTLIMGPAKQLSEMLNEEKTKAKADLIHRSAKKLNRLVNELLDISRIEAGEMKLKACNVNVVKLIKQISLSFYSLAERKNISFKIKSDNEDITAYLDKDKFDKILTNVLSNAFKFTPEGGVVEILINPKPSFNSSLPTRLAGLTKGGKEGGYFEISIRDTGIGIPEHQIDKIFDRFYQVDGSHTREQEGTGIGLALTKELAELHSGIIDVESEEGKGTVFKLYFPLGKDHLKPEQICDEDKISEEIIGEPEEYIEKNITTINDNEYFDNETTEKPSLLIVEDNPDVRTYVKMILEDQYKIYESKDGEEGLNKSFEIIPDLIISDIMMPKFDGFMLVEKLKTEQRTSHIPVIMLTAKATIKDKVNGLLTGADDYIMKPFEAEELKARIKNLLDQRKRLHDHFRQYGLLDVDNKNITSPDQLFMRNAIELITKHISDIDFDIEILSEKLNVSRSLLFKKVNALVGEPPGELIKRIRLNKAAALIEKKFGNISEIALEVGFANPSYFAECFKKHFGILPSHYHHKSGNS
jgi:signal transduction histidine kinase/ligand-binding sensor domain-containing protein/DNA-binding NarL/FixJ family response regulator